MKAIVNIVAVLLAGSFATSDLVRAAEDVVVPANAQEQAPEALLGVWKADVEASRYTGTPPRNNIRTFSFTQDGEVLVTSTTLNAEKRISMLHWIVQLDGTPAPEFTSSSRSTPASLVGLKMEDERTFVMTVSKHGAVTLTGQMTLSADGQTLTYVYGSPGGPQNHIVYRRWDMGG
jgi:hypothetical protein